MNYEEKYKEMKKRVLAIGQGYVKEVDYNSPRSIAEYIDPELRESEDERIRKAIICGMNALKEQHKETFASIPINDCIAWLEKQGAKKDTVTPQWMIDFLKEHRRNFATPMDYDEKQETDGKLLAVIKWLEGNPQLEQKPSWSEEDEEKRELLISILEVNHPNGRFKVNPINTLNMEVMSTKELVNWLKSIKPNHWKPSKEQLTALKNAIIGKRGPLYDLYFDLENL